MIQFICLLVLVSSARGQQVGCQGCPPTGVQQPLQQVFPQQNVGYQTAATYQTAQSQARAYPGQPCNFNTKCAGGTSCQNGVCACLPGYTQTLTDCIPGPNTASMSGRPSLPVQGYGSGLVQPGYQTLGGVQNGYQTYGTGVQPGFQTYGTGFQGGYQQPGVMGGSYPNQVMVTVGGVGTQQQPCGYQGQAGCNTGYQSYGFPQQQQVIYPQQQQVVMPGYQGYQSSQPCGYQGTGGCAGGLQQQGAQIVIQTGQLGNVPIGGACQVQTQQLPQYPVQQQQCVSGAICMQNVCQCSAGYMNQGGACVGKKRVRRLAAFRMFQQA